MRKKSGIDQTLQSAQRSVRGRMVNGSEVLSWTPFSVEMWSRTHRQPLVVSTYKQCKVQLLPKMEVRGSSRFLRLLRASQCTQIVMHWIIRFYTTMTEKMEPTTKLSVIEQSALSPEPCSSHSCRHLIVCEAILVFLCSDFLTKNTKRQPGDPNRNIS